MEDLYYVELCKNPIRFDAVSQLNDVFFDNSNKQIFTVRSGGETGVVVKGPTERDIIFFCMKNKGPIQSIKFSPDNTILAVQREKHIVEFIHFHEGQPQLDQVILYEKKKLLIHAFVWIHNRDVAIVSNNGIEIFTVNFEKKILKSIKVKLMPVEWFAWYPDGNLALASCKGNILLALQIKEKKIIELSKVDCDRAVPERDVTLGQIYGKLAILILQEIENGLLEVFVYLLNGLEITRKSHILRLGYFGRFAINVIDNLIIVHHQASATSMLFDLNLKDEIINHIHYHAPVTFGKTMKPFSLKIPSLSPDGQTMNCELYSVSWVFFQPNIVIDANLGCMWYLSLHIDSICTLITDRVRLTEFLLQRSNGKKFILQVLKQLVDDQYKGPLLPILENIFNRINHKNSENLKPKSQTNLLTSLKNLSKTPVTPTVIINQSEMLGHVFVPIAGKPNTEKILLLYLDSLNKYGIASEEKLSEMIVFELIRNQHYVTLQSLVEYSLIMESLPIACSLLSHSNASPMITQTALDMLKKINANENILQVLLEQGKVIDALKIVKSLPGNAADTIEARKYLEAAKRTNDHTVFYATFRYFQQRNLRLRNHVEFETSEQCADFVQHFYKLFPSEMKSK